MKKIFVALVLLFAVGVTPLLANDGTDVFGKAKASLEREFTGAASVEWTDLGDYQQALFTFNENRIEAYFNASGALEGFDRYISINQLPLEVLRSFAKHYPTAVVVDVLEIANAEGTSYRLNIEKQGQPYHVKISSAGTLLKQEKVESKAF